VPVLVKHGQLVVQDDAAAVDLVFDMATPTSCFRPVPGPFRGSSCRSLQWNRQLGTLDGAAAVDLVFDTYGLLEDLFLDADSLSFVPVLVGNGQLVVLTMLQASTLVFDMATSTSCFRPVFRFHFAVLRVSHR